MKINSGYNTWALFLKNVNCLFFFFFLFLHSSALYNEISGMLLSLEL